MPRLARKPPKRHSRSSKPKKAKKAPTLSKLKKELEALQKQIVIKLYGRDCFTCPAKDLEGMSCQLGHVPWPRSDLGPKAKFDPRFTRVQCFRCNINLGGNGAKALQRMIDEGIDTKAMRKESDAEKGKLVPLQWYKDEILRYKSLLESV